MNTTSLNSLMGLLSSGEMSVSSAGKPAIEGENAAFRAAFDAASASATSDNAANTSAAVARIAPRAAAAAEGSGNPLSEAVHSAVNDGLDTDGAAGELLPVNGMPVPLDAAQLEQLAKMLGLAGLTGANGDPSSGEGGLGQTDLNGLIAGLDDTVIAATESDGLASTGLSLSQLAAQGAPIARLESAVSGGQGLDSTAAVAALTGGTSGARVGGSTSVANSATANGGQILGELTTADGEIKAGVSATPTDLMSDESLLDPEQLLRPGMARAASSEAATAGGQASGRTAADLAAPAFASRLGSESAADATTKAPMADVNGRVMPESAQVDQALTNPGFAASLRAAAGRGEGQPGSRSVTATAITGAAAGTVEPGMPGAKADLLAATGLDGDVLDDQAIEFGAKLAEGLVNAEANDVGARTASSREAANGVNLGFQQALRVADGGLPTSSRAGSELSDQLADLYTAPDDAEFPSEVLGRVRMLYNQGASEARINLHPQELGRLQIQINTDGDQARVTFTVENQQARDAIEQAMPRLREMLQQAGLQLADSNVSQQQYSGDGQQADNSGGFGDGSARVFGRPESGSDVAVGAESSPITRRAPDPDRALDTYA